MTTSSETPRTTIDLPTTEEGWLERLGPAAYQSLRQGATERPGTGEYVAPRAAGTYECQGCGTELFTAKTQFDAHCGWPSFYAPTDNDAVTLIEDRSLGTVRTEVRCATCDGHLGHVFSGEGFPTPTDDRFCINSIALRHTSD